MSKPGYIYILTNKKCGILYIGVTSLLPMRISQHRQDVVEGFTKKYSLKQLVYYEAYDSIEDAIHRETGLKRWKRDWKIKLIEEANPEWRDLYAEICS